MLVLCVIAVDPIPTTFCEFQDFVLCIQVCGDFVCVGQRLRELDLSSDHISQLGRGLHCTLVSCACDDPLPDTHCCLIWLSTLLIFTKSNFSVGTLEYSL